MTKQPVNTHHQLLVTDNNPCKSLSKKQDKNSKRISQNNFRLLTSIMTINLLIKISKAEKVLIKILIMKK